MVWVFGLQIPLNDLCIFVSFEVVIHPGQELGMHEVVSIKEGYGVVRGKGDLGEGPANVVRLSRTLWVIPLKNEGSLAQSNVFRFVGTGIAGDVDVEEFFWVLLCSQALKEWSQDFFLVMGGNEDGEFPELLGLWEGTRGLESPKSDAGLVNPETVEEESKDFERFKRVV